MKELSPFRAEGHGASAVAAPVAGGQPEGASKERASEAKKEKPKLTPSFKLVFVSSLIASSHNA